MELLAFFKTKKGKILFTVMGTVIGMQVAYYLKKEFGIYSFYVFLATMVAMAVIGSLYRCRSEKKVS